MVEHPQTLTLTGGISMTIYCTYITFYSGNKLPPFYIGYSSIEKVKNGYNGSVSSKIYKKIWEKERKENPHLFKTKIIKTFKMRIDAGKHEEFVQKFFNVHKNPMFINRSIGYSQFNLDEAIQNKTHHFFNSKVQSEINMKNIRNGTHHFQNSEFQRSLSQRAKSKPEFHDRQSKQTSAMNTCLIENGTHNLLNCGDFVKSVIDEKLNRECVKRLKEIIKITPTRLGQNWWRKSDDWVNSKIFELIQ